MKITDIKKGRRYLSLIYIDGEPAVRLDSRVVLEEGINTGDILDDRQLKAYIEMSDLRRAKEKALWLISQRDYSKKELVDKISATCPRDAAAEAAGKMEELGLVNDEKFARRYARGLIKQKHLSKSAARYRLVQKGIDRDLADEILEENEPDPKEHIRAVIDKKYAKSLCDEKGRRRCVAALQRLGYGYSDINSVLREYIEDEY